MSFSFGKINTDNSRKVLQVSLEDNCLLYETSEPGIKANVLVDKYYSSSELTAINFFLKSNGLLSYRILSVVNSKDISPEIVKEELKEGIVKFYKQNQSNYRDYFSPGEKILSTGASIYALTGNDHIYVNDLYDLLFTPRKIIIDGFWVYVTDSFSDIFDNKFHRSPVDSYKTKFFQFRIKDLITEKEFPEKRKRIRKIHIEDKDVPSKVEEFIKENHEVISADTETSGLDFMIHRIGDFTFAFDSSTGYHINYNDFTKPHIEKLLKAHKILGANFSFDLKMLWKSGLDSSLETSEDVVKLGHTLNENRRNSLKTLAYLYSPYGGYDNELDEYKSKYKIDNYLDIPDDIRIPYSIMDVVVTFHIWKRMIKHIHLIDKKYPNPKSDYTLYHYYKNIRIPVDNMYARIEYRGVYINIEKAKEGRKYIEQELLKMRIQLYELLGKTPPTDFYGNFNNDVEHFFDSPTELGKFLAEAGWKNLGEGKSRGNKDERVFLTGDFQLSRWSQEHEAAKVLSRYRSASTILGTFLGDDEGTKGWSQYFREHPEDNSIRLHPDFNSMGTETGRSKCSRPNMQNPPSHGEFAHNAIRMMSTKNDEEYLMVTVDYSALQMRLATLDSLDPTLTEVFSSSDSKNTDVHTLTAFNLFRNQYFDVEEIEVIDDEGNKHFYLGGQLLRVIRKNTEIEIFAKDLKETDILM